MIVSCVLRSGGAYTVEYVERLAAGIREHLPSAEIVCLSDVAVPIERVPLENDWSGWWAKIELFRPRLFDGQSVLYLDLDTFIVGSLEELATYPHKFTMLSDFFHPQRAASGVMAWSGDWQVIYEEFTQAPALHMAAYSCPSAWGDQAFIADRLPFEPDRFQSLFPGQIVSRKVPSDRQNARIVCSHGRPRPHEVGWQA